MSATPFIIIFLAGLSAVGFGWIWYLPQVFGSAWMRMSNFTPEMQEISKKRMPAMAFIGLLLNMLCAFIMWYFAVAWGVYEWAGALQLAFWIWLGFTGPALMGQVLWDQKPFKLFLIHAFYWLFALMIMSLIIVYGAKLFIYGSFS